jgi:competence protein ComFB
MKNLLEGTLRELYSDLRARNPEFCPCERCQADVMALALNSTRPRYTGGSAQGMALASLDLQGAATRASLSVTLLDAMRRVGMNPNHSTARLPKNRKG